MGLPKMMVPGVSRVDLPYGLFSVVPPREDPSTLWEPSGIEFETIGLANGAIVGFAEGCSESPPDDWSFTVADGIEVQSGCSFRLQAEYSSNAIGRPRSWANEVARDRLLFGAEDYVEKVFDQGLLSVTPNMSDPTALDDADTLEDAIALAEQAIGEEYGVQGIIHLGRALASKALTRKHIESRGGRLHTLMGTPVVAGVGYSFDGLKITPPLLAYQSEIYFLPEDVLLDRGKNDQYGLAQRYFALGMDDGEVYSIAIPGEDD